MVTVPFRLRRPRTLASPGDITAIREIVHGTIRLDRSQLAIEWWIDRITDRLGREIRTDREATPRHRITLPIAGLARVTLVRDPWWRRPRRVRLTLEARDQRVFAPLAGSDGLVTADPTTVVVRLRPGDHEAGRELATDLGLAIGDLALREASSPPSRDDP